jgi:hypothetical protein
MHAQVIVQKLLGMPFEMGYNAMDDTIEDLMAAGVIDPAKVTKNGLLNSCSIAGIMLTTQVGEETLVYVCACVFLLHRRHHAHHTGKRERVRVHVCACVGTTICTHVEQERQSVGYR